MIPSILPTYARAIYDITRDLLQPGLFIFIGIIGQSGRACIHLLDHRMFNNIHAKNAGFPDIGNAVFGAILIQLFPR